MAKNVDVSQTPEEVFSRHASRASHRIFASGSLILEDTPQHHGFQKSDEESEHPEEQPSL